MTESKSVVSKLMSGRSGQMKSYVAVLLVSVGKENFEGALIQSAIQMINEEFHACCIVVADTLQRYNIATERQITPEDAHEESLKKGNTWLQNHQILFKNFTIPYEVIKWDDLIGDPGFKKHEMEFLNIFLNAPQIQQEMHHSIAEYGDRLQRRMGVNQFSKRAVLHEQFCHSYLQEECVAIALLPHKTKLVEKNTPITIVYPGKATGILTTNRNLFLTKLFPNQFEDHTDYLNWLPYRFNRIRTDQDTPFSSKKIKRNKGEHFDKIKEIHDWSEAQLFSLLSQFNDPCKYEFNTHVLRYLLKNELSRQEISLEKLKAYSSSLNQILAYSFSIQMFALFGTLEEEIANQCRANIVRILKKINAQLDLQHHIQTEDIYS